MGQCFSGPKRGASRRVDVPAARQQETGVTDRVLYPVISTGGLQVAVSQARCAAGAGGDATPLLVRQTPLHTFIALFEGLGEDRRAVAAFCRTRAFEVGKYCRTAAACSPAQPRDRNRSDTKPHPPLSRSSRLQLFQESSVRHSDSPLEALKETAERLDAAIFATDRLSHVVRGACGARVAVGSGGWRPACLALRRPAPPVLSNSTIFLFLDGVFLHFNLPVNALPNCRSRSAAAPPACSCWWSWPPSAATAPTWVLPPA